MAFCDFCPCADCTHGRKNLAHAPTDDGRWICEVCFEYDVCVDAKRDAGGPVDGPCEDHACAHRPKLVDGWERIWPAVPSPSEDK